MTKPLRQHLKKKRPHTYRLDDLEERNRWHLHTLNVISELLDMYRQLDARTNAHQFITRTIPYILKITPFEAIGFCSIKSTASTATIDHINNESYSTYLHQDMDTLLQRGDFEAALHSHTPKTYRCNNRTLVLASLITPSRIRGLFIAYVSNSNVFKEHHKKGLHTIVHNCAYALESHELHHVIKGQNEHLIKSFVSRTAELKERQNTDSLTQLPNRQHLQKSLQHYIDRARFTNKKLALVLLNLDLFKLVNESLGHLAGDSLLQNISQRLVKSLQRIHASNFSDQNSAYTISHLGADEFCILLSDIDHVEQINHVMMQLSLDLLKPYQHDSHEIIQTFSAGISIFPDHTLSGSELLTFANIALTHSKSKGRNQYAFYDHDKNDRAVDQLHLSRKLHQALNENKFILHFQPQINMLTHEISGIEALIRWPLNEGIMIPPDRFIPLAEDMGLIVPIGNWVIEETCKHLQQLQCAGFGDIPISVNIAAQHFCRDDFVKTLTATVNHYNLPARLIELEVTERIVMAEKEAVFTLNALRNFGFRIAIDDFGTGYSSLSYLKNFPVDRLKIDKSFIADIPDDKGSKAIVTAITQLARNIGLSVIAEGIENIHQANFMQSIGCLEAQGYFYSKPLCAENLMVFLQNNRTLLKTQHDSLG